jgi:hypothetical protein
MLDPRATKAWGRAGREHPLEEVCLQQGLEGSEMQNVYRGGEIQEQSQATVTTWLLLQGPDLEKRQRFRCGSRGGVIQKES